MSSLQRWIDSHAEGFGDVAFMVTGDGQWASEALTVTRRIPGSNNFITQYLGRGPETVSLELMLATPEEFHNLKSLTGQSGTLTVLAGYTALPDLDPAVIAGDDYERIADVVLTDVKAKTTDLGGIVTCDATFIRAASDTPIAVLRLGDT